MFKTMQKSEEESKNMQFPITPPAQMPCPHWNHFPIHPEVQKCNKCDPSSPPSSPSPDCYDYCTLCGAKKDPFAMFANKDNAGEACRGGCGSRKAI